MEQHTNNNEFQGHNKGKIIGGGSQGAIFVVLLQKSLLFL